MVTPKRYKDALSQHIITTEMLCDALFSVNKRAKNYRDAERKCRDMYNGKYSESNCRKKETFYAKKERLLSVLTPTCIHREFAGYERARVYSYDKNYDKLFRTYALLNRIVWCNSYWDYDGCREICFFDYVVDKPRYRYYLYYVCGTYTFHHPIPEESLSDYALDIVDIGQLNTKGNDYHDLLSMQFVDKMLAALFEGQAVYQQTVEDDPEIFPYEPAFFEEEYGLTKDAVSDEMANSAKEILRRVLPLVEVSEEQIDSTAVRSKIRIKQKFRKKCYTRPDVRGLNVSIRELLLRDDMIDFVYERMFDVTNIDDLLEQLMQTCIAKDSPVYEELCDAARKQKALNAAVVRVREEAVSLYEATGSKIINDRGVLRCE